jgi:homoserine dehydrogenase
MRIILTGFGAVGQNLAKILRDENERFVHSYGFKPSIVAVSDSQGYCADENGLDLNKLLRTKERLGTVARYPGKGGSGQAARSLIDEVEAEVLVEATPTNFHDGEPGLSNIKRALASGKHVVTTNKGPLALAMPALLELAQHKALRLRFSGTVGAGTPFLDLAEKCLPGDSITGIWGILNGTTNYILTRMEEGSVNLKKALSEAQAKGYAESDSSSDIEGLDTAAKVVIISNWVLKRRVSIKDLEIIGINNISPELLRKARMNGKKIKLIGRLDESQASVKPEEVPFADPVCVPGVLNALSYSTKHSGQVTLIGPGAGGEQTASAVIRDLVDIRGEYIA